MKMYSIFNYLNFPIMQDAVSPFMEFLTEFHDNLMFLLIIIVSVIVYSFCFIFFSKVFSKSIITVTRSEFCEMIFTIIPIIFLIFNAIPSISTIYAADESMFPNVTIEATGHQWYWSYEYTDYDISFDSTMVNEEMLTSEMLMNNTRLLDVDNSMVIPTNTPIRMLISSDDVLHSWTLPSAGVKVDAVPGRLNSTELEVDYAGLNYGQCSELCGGYHAYMPICVESVDDNTFTKWICSKFE